VSEARGAFGLNGVPCVEESRERAGSHKRVDHQRRVVALAVHSTSGSTIHIEAIHDIQEPQRRSPRTSSYRQPLKYSPS